MHRSEGRQGVDWRALTLACVAGSVGLVVLHVYQRRLVLETSGGVPVSVVVAATDVAEGTVLERGLLAVRQLPTAYVEQRHVRAEDIAELVGAKTGVKVRASEALLWTDLALSRRQATDLSSLVQPGMRAVTVRTGTFDGLLRAGDRVDVLGAVGSPRDTALLQNLVVLAVGGAVFAEEASHAGADEGVTLGGTFEQGRALAEAARAGAVSLALRGPDDVGVSREADVELSPSPDGARARRRAPGTEIEHVR